MSTEFLNGAEPPRRGRGRPKKVVPDHISLTDQVKRAEAKLAEIKEALRASNDRVARIFGRAVLAALERGPEQLRRLLIEWLRISVTNPSDRAEIAPYLTEGGKK